MSTLHKDTVNAVLKTYLQNFSDAFSARDIENCYESLVAHFTLMRDADAQNLFGADELTEHVNAFSRGVLDVSNLSHISAFTVACAAWKECKAGVNRRPCSELLINTVGVLINSFAHSAMTNVMGMRGSTSTHVKMQEGRSFVDASPYISAVANVLMVTSKYFKSQPLQDTFYEALTEFERMLSSVFFTPSERYRLVRKIVDFAEAQFPKAGALLDGMNDLLREATFLPSGQGIIRSDFDIQADEIAADTKAYAPQKPVNIKTALALRAGVPSVYAGLYQQIENALKNRAASRAEDKLCLLFEKIITDDNDVQDERSELSATHYFTRAAGHLLSLSIKNGFHLAARCIEAIDRAVGVPEPIQKALYGFALPVMADWELSAFNGAADTKELNKIVMRNTSEFDDEDAAEDLFNCSSLGYEAYLMTVDPVVRHKEITALSDWVKERSVESPMLVDFVNEWLEEATLYDDELGIPMGQDNDPRELTLVHSRAPN